MSRILIACAPVPGHVAPFIPLCRALVARGHDVAWYTGRAQQHRVVTAGARYFPFQIAREYDPMDLDASFPERSKLKGVQQFIFDMKEGFVGFAPGQCADLERIHRTFAFDVVVADPLTLGALFFQEKHHLPAVMMNVMPLALNSVDTAPFGLGLHPSSTVFGRLRNRVLKALVQGGLFRSVQRRWLAVRNEAGLPPTGWFMDCLADATTYLQPTIPGFEYPRSDLPKCVQFIGMMPADRPTDVPTPDFWPELHGHKPVVHLTQGTVANHEPELIKPALEGLKAEDVLVVVSTGDRPPEALGLNDVPRNVRVARFLSYPDLLPKTRVMVTNGGYGGVQLALSHGVPVVAAGRTEDKPEVSARVAWSGAGIDLKTAKPTPAAVRNAVRAVLRDGKYAARAKELAAEHTRYDAVGLAVEAVERASGVTVPRPRVAPSPTLTHDF